MMTPKTWFLTLLSGAVLAQTAQAASVTPAVKAEANQLARQYTGRVCKSTGSFDLTVEPFKKRLSTAEVKLARDYAFQTLLQEFDKSAHKHHYTYEVRYNGNRVWARAKLPQTHQTFFSVGTISPTGIRMLSCEQ